MSGWRTKKADHGSYSFATIAVCIETNVPSMIMNFVSLPVRNVESPKNHLNMDAHSHFAGSMLHL